MMKKTIKKVLATVLSATMVMSMSMATFATDTNFASGESHIFYNEVESVIVPTTFTIGMNPQKLTFEVPSATTTTSNAQIMATKIGVVNKSTRAKKVTVKLAAAVATGSGMTVSAESIQFKDSKEAVENKGKDDYFIYLSAQPLASGEAVKIISGSAWTGIDENIATDTAAKLGNVQATTTTAGAVTITTATDTAMSFKLAEAVYGLKSGTAVNLVSAAANDLSGEYKVTSLPTESVTAFEITGAMNAKALWSKIGEAKVNIVPTYKIEDAEDGEDIVEGTANLIAGAGGSSSYVSTKSISASNNSLSLTLPSGVTLSSIELLKSGATTPTTMVANSHYTVSGNVYTFKSDMVSKWSGATLTFKYSDKKSDVVTVK